MLPSVAIPWFKGASCRRCATWELRGGASGTESGARDGAKCGWLVGFPGFSLAYSVNHYHVFTSAYSIVLLKDPTVSPMNCVFIRHSWTASMMDNSALSMLLLHDGLSKLLQSEHVWNDHRHRWFMLVHRHTPRVALIMLAHSQPS